MGTETLSNKLQRRTYKFLQLLFSIGMGFFTYIGVMEFFSYDSIMRLISLFTLVPVFFFFVIFIHEMGHAIAAWTLKYRVHFIAVGMLGFNPEKRRFKQVDSYAANEIAGFIQYSPKWPLKNRWGEILVSLAGPLGTILLGLVFLYLHEHFGERPEHFSLPKNIPPRILDGDGNVLFDSLAKRSYTVPHIGLLYLAIVCFLDAIFNLLPLKSGNDHNSDGRNIYEALFQSKWTAENFLNTRAYASYYYGQEAITDEEWQEVRQECWGSPNSNFQQILRQAAWIKTDPEAFLKVTHITFVDTEKSEALIWQYIVSSILMGHYSEGLKRLLPDTIQEKDHIYHFANVLLKYGEGDKNHILKAITEAREIFISVSGRVPDEEDAIFTAIEDEQALPELKW